MLMSFSTETALNGLLREHYYPLRSAPDPSVRRRGESDSCLDVIVGLESRFRLRDASSSKWAQTRAIAASPSSCGVLRIPWKIMNRGFICNCQ